MTELKQRLNMHEYQYSRYETFVLLSHNRLNLIERLDVSTSAKLTRDGFDFARRQSGSRRFRSWNSLFVSVSLLRSVRFYFS